MDELDAGRRASALERHPGRLFVERYGPVRSEEDVVHYVDFLREEAGLDDTPPINLARIHARFGIPTPVLADLPSDQHGVLLDGDPCIILINEGDPEARRRFSNAHELVEMLFAAHEQVADADHWRRRFGAHAKEQLCESGAASLLLPRSSFVPLVMQEGVSLRGASLLAEMYDTSLLATLFQMVRLGPGMHGLAVWRHALKPTQQRLLPSELQPSLFGDSLDLSIATKLRVWWSTATPGQSDMYLPKHKSTSEDSLISRAYNDNVALAGVEVIDFGRSQLRCMVEAKRIVIAGEIAVVSLLHGLEDGSSVV